MTIKAGSRIYKSADPRYYKPNQEFDTSTYNYGLRIATRSGHERAEFDRFLIDSKANGTKLGTYLVAALPRVGHGFEGQRYGAAFREHFIERVRVDVCPTAPSRRQVIFAGAEKSHVDTYRRLAKPQASVLVTLEVIRCDQAFTGDMAVLDELEVFSHNYDEGRSIIERYWLGVQAEKLCPELLVRGRFKWGTPL